MRKQYVVIEGKYTGRQPVFLDPQTVTEVVVGLDGMWVRLEGSGVVKLQTLEARSTSGRDAVLRAVFPEEALEGARAIHALLKRYINPACVSMLNYAGGRVEIGVGAGDSLSSGNASTDQYKALVGALYGEGAAAEVKPLEAAPTPLIQTVEDKLAVEKKRREFQEKHEWNQKQAAEELVRCSPGAQKVTATNALHALDFLTDELRDAIMHLHGNPAIMSSEAWTLKARLCGAKHLEFDAAVRVLAGGNSPAKFAAIVGLADELAAMVNAFPNGNQEITAIKKKVAKECDRLSLLRSIAADPEIERPAA